MTENYWLSRRSKYDLEETFRIALHYVLKLKPYEAFKCLRLAAAQGHEEAIFLNKHFETYGATPAYGNPNNTVMTFSRHSFERNDDPRALKYALWFMEPYERNSTLLWRLAEDGEAMAQYMVAQHTKWLNDIDGAIRWHRKAAEQNFAPSIYKLSRLSRNGKVDTAQSDALLFRAAQLGYGDAVSLLGDNFRWNEFTAVSPVMRTRFQARLIMIRTLQHAAILANIVKFRDSRLPKEGIGKVFAIGQEFDDYIKYYPELNDKMSSAVQPSVKIYQQMTSSSRHANVQTILIMRKLGVCRDVAILIAKLVYASRAESDWYVPIR